jgi:cytochrome P450
MTTTTDMATAGRAPELYDPLHDTRLEEVYQTYAVLRRDAPVYYSERRQVWCLSRHADVQAAARDWETFSSIPGTDLDTPNLYGPGNFLDDDPPRHDSLRNIVRPFFIPKAIDRLGPEIAGRVEAIIAELREKPTVDLAADFALRLPTWVISRLLGAHEDDDALVQRLVLEIESHEPGETEVSDRALTAVRDLRSYLSDLLAHKARHPDDRVMSHLAACVSTHELSKDQAIGMAGVLFGGGTETTYALIGNILNLLAEHPSALEALRSEGAALAIDSVIEEALRFEAPVQYVARTARQPAIFHEVTIPRGGRVILLWAAANRDPARWDRPDEFDIRRERSRHVSFGEGIHFCVGAPLARLETRIALPAFLRAFSEYEISAKRRRNHHLVRGWDRLEARLVRSAR